MKCQLFKLFQLKPINLKLKVKFTKIIQISFTNLLDSLKTPVYVTQNRRNAMGVGLVFEADLQTEEHLSHWILQGVCLVLNIDY